MNQYKPELLSTPYGATHTFTFDKMKVTDIVVNQKYKYKPKEDITNYELAMMLHLFAFFPSNHYAYDYWEFITRNKLERHFDEQ